MYVSMKKLRVVIVHLLIISGIILVCFSAVLVYKSNPQARKAMEQLNSHINYQLLLKQAFINLIYFAAVIYSFYFFIFNLLFKSKVKFRQIILSVLVVLGLNCLLQGSNFLLFKSCENKAVIENIIFTIIIGGIGLGARAILEYFNDKEKKKELEQKTIQSELNLLRSQINPHFLFNTLNNIDTLIRKDATKASDLLIKLSVQMRYMLYDSNTEKIDLGSEIEFIKDYISLQMLRIKNQDAVKADFNGDYKNILVPPMLFIPFIENAFKHCSDTNVNDAIVFRIEANENGIIFESENLFDDDFKGSKDKTGGVGIDLAQKRLQLLYPGKHTLDISKKDNRFHVSLNIEFT